MSSKGVGPSSASNPSIVGGAIHRTPAAWILPCILVASAAMDLFFFTGYYGSDDARYLSGARAVLETGALPSEPSLAHTRLTMLGWNLLIAHLFGLGAQTIAASYVFFHLVLNALTYVAGKRLFDRTVGLIAAYCVATFPLIVIHATMILPELILASAILGSVLCFIAAWDAGERGSVRLQRCCMALAGVCVGVAYLAKESGLVLMPFYLVAWLFMERGRGKQGALIRGGLLLTGFAGVFLVEWLLLSYLTGRSFLRLGWSVHGSSDPGILFWDQYLTGYYPLERLASFRHRCLSPAVFPKVLQLVFALGVVIYLFIRDRRLVLLLLPCWYFVYYTWGSSSPLHYKPVHIQARHYLALVPFLAIISAASLTAVYRWAVARLPGRIRSVAAAGAVLLVVIHPIFGLNGPNRRAGKMYLAQLVGNTLQAVRFAGEHEGVPVLLAGDLHELVEPVLVVDAPRNLEDAGAYDEAKAMALLRTGGFLYVQRDPEARPTPATDSSAPLDVLLKATAEVPSSRPSIAPSLSGARHFWSAEPDGADRIFVGGYLLELVKLGRFNAPRTRAQGAWTMLACPGGMIPHEWRTVHVLEVSVRPIPAATLPATLPAGDLAPKLSRPGRWPRLKYFGGWKVWADEDEDYEVVGGEDHRATIVLKGLRDGQIDYLPQKEDPPDLRVPADAKVRVDVDTEASESIQAELTLEIYADRKSGKPIRRRRLRLSGGTTVLGLYTDDRSVRLRPVFKLGGSGDFTLNRFAVVREP
ncbi:MAG: glycosyltransferase family 39 protein [Phycisphaerae bacterium]|nr:glycosyltransferase family 39 protein [Phycisphaerae bacterium]